MLVIKLRIDLLAGENDQAHAVANAVFIFGDRGWGEIGHVHPGGGIHGGRMQRGRVGVGDVQNMPGVLADAERDLQKIAGRLERI